MSSSLIHKTADISDGLVIQIIQAIDFSHSPKLRTNLIDLINDNKPARLVIDLSQVPYMDSSGVATLIEALQAQNKSGNKLVLCAMQPRVQGIFEIARLDTVFTITADTDSAAVA